MTITSFNDKATARIFQAACLRALEEVAQRHGVQMDAGNWRYGGDSLDMRFTAKCLDANGQPKKDPLFERMLEMRGLDASKVGYHNGTGYRLVGYNPNRPKNCWKIVRDHDGKDFICPNSFAERLFQRTTPVAAAAMVTNPAPSNRYDAEF